MHLDPEYLQLAFHEGPAGDAELFTFSAGALSLPSGRLVACDPFVFYGSPEPFSLPLPEGDHPVTLVIARWPEDQRVAFARVDFGAGVPTQWDLLTTKGQDHSQLGPDEVFGCGVDAGTGCFADERSMHEFGRRMEQAADYSDGLLKEMERTYVHTWSWANWDLGSGLNVVAFSSGVGDGLYPTYVAMDAQGDILSVVTDFIVLPGSAGGD